MDCSVAGAGALDAKTHSVSLEGAALDSLRDRELLRLHEWIELTLHVGLAREHETADDAGLPGWGLSLGRARVLLSATDATLAEEVLLTKRNAVEHALFDDGGQDRGQGGQPTVLSALQAAFALSRFELQVLLLALAPDLHGTYAKAIGFLHDDLNRRRMSTTLLLQLLGSESRPIDLWNALDDHRPLGRYGLLLEEIGDTSPISERGWVVAEDIGRFVVQGLVSTRGASLAVRLAQPRPGVPLSRSTTRLRDELAAWLDRVNHTEISRNGQGGAGQEVCRSDLDGVAEVLRLALDPGALTWFESACDELQIPVVCLDVERFEGGGGAELVDKIMDHVLCAARLARLADGLLLLVRPTGLPKGLSALLDGVVIPRLQCLVTKLAVAGDVAWVGHSLRPVRCIRRPVLDAASGEALWQESQNRWALR